MYDNDTKGTVGIFLLILFFGLIIAFMFYHNNEQIDRAMQEKVVHINEPIYTKYTTKP